MYAHKWWLGLLLVTGIVSCRTTDFNIQGTTAKGWEFVRELFQENFALERDLGGSIAIYHHGDLVVDLQGGWFDRAQVQPYDSNTLQLVFSTTKGLTAIAVALCVQRGLLDYSALVTQYWPEYGQNGKANTTVSDIMAHRAGLPLESATNEQHLNWATMINILEAQQPLWPPGTQHGYHALTYGWLAGELVRRVDPSKRTLGQFIRDEIARPLDLEFYIGLPAELEYRVSPLDYNSTGNASGMVSYDVFNDPRLHQAELPAANGITNARSLARLYASCLSDIDNDKYKRLLTKDVLDVATKLNTPAGELDFVLHFPTQFAMGFSYFDEIFTSFGKGVFGHNGVGGSIGFAAPEKQFVFAYVMNQMGAEIAVDIDLRYRTILDRIATKLNNSSGALHHSSVMLASTISMIMLLKKFILN